MHRITCESVTERGKKNIFVKIYFPSAIARGMGEAPATQLALQAVIAPPPVGTLSGTTVKYGANGVATLFDLSIDMAGAMYQLLATGGNAHGGHSAAFNITAP